MDFFELAQLRRSVRKYSDKKVEKEKIQSLLEISGVAPTARNNQPQRILVIESDKGLQKLAKTANIFGGPLALVVCVDHEESWHRQMDGKDSGDVDAAIIAVHIMLQATHLGLGTVCVGNFDSNMIKKEFDFPPSIEPIGIIVVGYAETQMTLSERRDLMRRRDLEETIVYESFTQDF
jgi:nitroreductase